MYKYALKENGTSANEKDNEAAEGEVEENTKDTEGKVFFVTHHVTSFTNNVI